MRCYKLDDRRDWNADLDEHRNLFDDVAYRTGGQISDPLEPTFTHRNPQVTKQTKIDFTISNVRNIHH